MLTAPFLQELEPAQNILIAGIGGGFDVFSGLPLYFGLQQAGKRVHLANLSFSQLPPEPDARLAPTLLRVSAATPLVDSYFPERYLAEWFCEQLWINPLMTIYWCSRLAPVAERILYRDAMLPTRSYLDINYAILEFRTHCQTIRPPMAIPL